LDNVRVGASFGGRGNLKDGGRRESWRVLERTGLLAKAEWPARSLTLPDRKRLEIARALATRPALLLLDEVAAGHNPAEIASAISLVRALREDGVTILIIEHVMKAVMELSDRIVVLDQGELIAEGSPGEIAAHPRVVEAYLGKGHGSTDELSTSRGDRC
jgi:branched-chain amino acid transport system ATP-binding protein